MRAANIAAVKAKLSAYVDEARRGPIVVTRHGQPAAILVHAPTDPDELERFLVANNPTFQRLVRRSRRSRLIPHDRFWREMEKRYGPYAR